MYFKGLTFIFSEDPPENHLKVIGGLLLKYYVLLLLFLFSILFVRRTICTTVQSCKEKTVDNLTRTEEKWELKKPGY